MKRLYAFFICLLAILAMQAQIVTTTPDFPTENDEVTIVFDATKGTAGFVISMLLSAALFWDCPNI